MSKIIDNLSSIVKRELISNINLRIIFFDNITNLRQDAAAYLSTPYSHMSTLIYYGEAGDAQIDTLEHLGQEKAAREIESAVMSVTKNKLKSLSAGKMGYGTKEVGDLVAQSL